MMFITTDTDGIWVLMPICARIEGCRVQIPWLRVTEVSHLVSVTAVSHVVSLLPSLGSGGCPKSWIASGLSLEGV